MSTFEKEQYSPVPRFYVAGVDVGQKQDHSAVALVDKVDKRFALAIYYARLEPTEYHPVAAVNTRPRPGNLFPQLPRSIWKT